MIGATDEVEKNKWINTHSGTVFHDIQWFLGEPNGGRDSNCLNFHRQGNWYITDDPCHVVTQTFENGFMCEITQ